MNKEIKMWVKYLGWFGIKPETYLSEEDIKKLGFKETLQKGHFMYFKKGNMSLKWDFHIEHRMITLRWGKSMRFLGNVETKEELKSILNKVNRYFG